MGSSGKTVRRRYRVIDSERARRALLAGGSRCCRSHNGTIDLEYHHFEASVELFSLSAEGVHQVLCLGEIDGGLGRALLLSRVYAAGANVGIFNVECKIETSITDFGIFIGLEGGIDGLIHLSDISWTEPSEEAVKKYKKGDTVESLIIAIDVPKERISLGVKQLTEDPNPSSTKNEEVKKVEPKSKEEKKTSKPKTSDKKEKPSKDIENAGTTNLGALLKAKLDDGKE